MTATRLDDAIVGAIGGGASVAALSTRPARVVFVALRMLSVGALVVLAVVQLLPGGAELTPPRLMRALLYFSIVPAVAALLLRAIARRAPSTLPASRPARPPVDATGSVAPQGGLRGYAVARWRAGTPVWHRWWLKFGLFAVLPVFVAFRLHQWVMYGGLLGQYYMHGLRPYLSTLVFHWVLVTVYLVLYAALWRALAEPAALAATVAGLDAARVRRVAEITLAVVYYLGVPLWMAWRFFIA